MPTTRQPSLLWPPLLPYYASRCCRTCHLGSKFWAQAPEGFRGSCETPWTKRTHVPCFLAGPCAGIRGPPCPCTGSGLTGSRTNRLAASPAPKPLPPQTHNSRAPNNGQKTGNCCTIQGLGFRGYKPTSPNPKP